jgi:hypothetical protein
MTDMFDAATFLDDLGDQGSFMHRLCPSVRLRSGASLKIVVLIVVYTQEVLLFGSLCYWGDPREGSLSLLYRAYGGQGKTVAALPINSCASRVKVGIIVSLPPQLCLCCSHVVITETGRPFRPHPTQLGHQ